MNRDINHKTGRFVTWNLRSIDFWTGDRNEPKSWRKQFSVVFPRGVQALPCYGGQEPQTRLLESSERESYDSSCREWINSSLMPEEAQCQIDDKYAIYSAYEEEMLLLMHCQSKKTA